MVLYESDVDISCHGRADKLRVNVLVLLDSGTGLVQLGLDVLVSDTVSEGRHDASKAAQCNVATVDCSALEVLGEAKAVVDAEDVSIIIEHKVVP